VQRRSQLGVGRPAAQPAPVWPALAPGPLAPRLSVIDQAVATAARSVAPAVRQRHAELAPVQLGGRDELAVPVLKWMCREKMLVVGGTKAPVLLLERLRAHRKGDTPPAAHGP
jgi:hypothetical protein